MQICCINPVDGSEIRRLPIVEQYFTPLFAVVEYARRFQSHMLQWKMGTARWLEEIGSPPKGCLELKKTIQVFFLFCAALFLGGGWPYYLQIPMIVLEFVQTLKRVLLMQYPGQSPYCWWFRYLAIHLRLINVSRFFCNAFWCKGGAGLLKHQWCCLQ